MKLFATKQLVVSQPLVFMGPVAEVLMVGMLVAEMLVAKMLVVEGLMAKVLMA